MLKEGDKAPAFEAPDQDGNTHALKDYEGEWVLLYFYPRDNTPGCTKEACSFRDNFADLKKELTILGASADSVEKHKGFAEKYELPFPLLAGKDNGIVGAYGADGKTFKKRTSFLIDPEGTIRKLYKSVKPLEHAEQVMRDVVKLKA